MYISKRSYEKIRGPGQDLDKHTGRGESCGETSERDITSQRSKGDNHHEDGPT